MNVQILENAQAIGAAVGQLFVEQVKTQPDSVLGLATGSSPIPTYQYMAQEYAAGHVSFRNVTTFNLDEYCRRRIQTATILLCLTTFSATRILTRHA